MKFIKTFLMVAVALCSVDAVSAPISTAGSNLTGYNGSAGAVNNNMWNQMLTTRSDASKNTGPAKADFGNCNSLILRCASPKCANGGCTSMDVALPIAEGCVNASSACKKHGAELARYIAAQLVATSESAKQQQELAAAQATQSANNDAIAKMQAQMDQMRSDFQAQNAASAQQLQAALAENKQLVESAANATIAAKQQAPVAPSPTELTDVEKERAAAHMSEELLARNRVAGEVMTKIYDVQQSMKELKNSMLNAFHYAGCDDNGNNCTGPKRVKRFKTLATDFFNPYQDVLSSVYDALITAQHAGIDLSDIYMLLNDGCARWGQYLCQYPDVYPTYQENKRYCEGRDSKGKCDTWKGDNRTSDTRETACYEASCCAVDGCCNGKTKNGSTCKPGQTIPESQAGGCHLIRELDDTDEVSQTWIDADDDRIKVACASAALESFKLFSNLKKSSVIDVETLERILSQDAPTFSSTRRKGESQMAGETLKYCAITERDYMDLQKYATTKSLPKQVCINQRTLDRNTENEWIANSQSLYELAETKCTEKRNTKLIVKGKERSDTKNNLFSQVTRGCYCNTEYSKSKACDDIPTKKIRRQAEEAYCRRLYNISQLKCSGGADGDAIACDCSKISADDKVDKESCEARFTSWNTGDVCTKSSDIK